MEAEDNNKILEERAWEFFKLHAKQRIMLFRFYITLTIALIIGFFYLYSLTSPEKTIFTYLALIGSSLGLLFITMIFCRLDKRNKELLDNTKELFLKIDDRFKLKTNQSFLKLCKHQNCLNTHQTLFKLYFFAIYIVGIALVIASVFKTICEIQGKDIIWCRPSVHTSQTNEEKTNNQYSHKKKTQESESQTRTTKKTIPVAIIDTNSTEQYENSYQAMRGDSTADFKPQNISIPFADGRIIIQGYGYIQYIPGKRAKLLHIYAPVDSKGNIELLKATKIQPRKLNNKWIKIDLRETDQIQ